MLHLFVIECHLASLETDSESLFTPPCTCLLYTSFWPQTDKKALNALRRPTCILVSLVLILAILTAVVMLVVPELVNAFGVLADQVPVFLKNAQAWLLANGDAFPALQDWLSSAQIDWNGIGKTLFGYVTTGAGNILGGTVHVVTGIAGGTTNTIICLLYTSRCV